jgi:hypothetical protein
MNFTEHSTIEAGFGKVFDERVAPELERIEGERQELLRTAKMHAGIPLGIAVLIALWALIAAGDLEGKLVGAIVPLAFGGVIAFFLWRRQAAKWGGTVAQAVMPAVCEFLGELDYDKTARKRFPLDRIQGLGLIGDFNRSNLEDRLEGTYRDTDFEMVEAKLRRVSHDSDGDKDTKTVFNGLLIRVGVPEPMPTDILIARDFGSVGNKLGELFSFGTGRSMPKVSLDHEGFEKMFEVYADDPDAARDCMPPAFLDNLMAIAEEEGGAKGARAMTAGFQGESFYLALDRREPFMEMGSLTQPVGEIEDDLHRVFDDLALIRRIIDRLHGDQPSV